MPRNGSGVFNPITNSWSPAINGVSATAIDWNSILADLSSALTQSVSADGQTPISGNIGMSNNKLTGLAAGSGTGDSVRWEQLFDQGIELDLASASVTDIGVQNTNFLRITGTTAITSFGTNYRGPRFVRFADVLTLTHNATTLILPTGANITTAAGDTAIIIPKAASSSPNGWQVVAYQRASGDSLKQPGAATETTAGIIEIATTAEVATGTDNTRAVTPAGLVSRASSETQTGLIELATTAEARAGTDATRALTPARLKDAQIQNATPISASGAAVDFTGIPSWAKRVLMVVQAGSFSGAGSLRMQLGTSGGVIASGYSGSHSLVTNSVVTAFAGNGFEIGAASAGNVFTGILQLVRITGDVWVGNGVFSLGDTPCTMTTSGYVSLPGTLDRVRFTSTSGANFDGGVVNVFWE